ncbi:MAG: 16S rRNA (guanine(527)-N(7))-methyltransferase RsmG [Phycisphaerae bacterium]|jgi:16S rRNA (guanine527-N7)-methyltransferase
MDPDLQRFRETLETTLRSWSLTITRPQSDQLAEHFQAVLEANRVMNLTRITHPAEAAVKHYADSLALCKWAKECGVTINTILDVGTGAGFPAVPLAVRQPRWSVTAIDATRKKLEFVRRTATALNLTNLHCEHAHSDHWCPEQAQSFDVVTFRALRKLPEALAQTGRFIGHEGRLIAYRTGPPTADTSEAETTAPSRLRLAVDARYGYTLPWANQTIRRHLLILRRADA